MQLKKNDTEILKSQYKIPLKKKKERKAYFKTNATHRDREISSVY